MVVQCCWPACLAYIFSWILQLNLFPLQNILYLHNSLEEVNSALVEYKGQNDLKFEGMNETVSNLTQSVDLVERFGCYEQDKKANKPVNQHHKSFQIFCDVSVSQCLLSAHG